MSVKYQLDGDVAVITLSRPDRYNAIEANLAMGVIDSMERAGSEARAVVLTGEGKAFCSGADLSVLQAEDGEGPDLAELLDNVFHPMIHALTEAPVPVVAAVNGVAAGAGMGIALGCDIRVMADSAFFMSAFTAIGLAPDSGTTYWLPQHVGVSKAIELAMTNKRVPADEAYRMGLCAEVVPDHEVVGKAIEMAKTLAEPNLMALSGETASFLAGGEFPIPVAQDDNTISVEFKEFGVALAFTPTVLDDGLINLAISVEESNIDTRPNAPDISIQGVIETPSLVTRRRRSLAGLLQDDFADTVEQVPWLGDLPILGTLFRSSAYRRGETELVILATPRLVKPTPAGSLASPTDNFVPPSDVEFFLFGQMEGPESGIGPLGSGAGGIDGSYGHIIK